MYITVELYDDCDEEALESLSAHGSIIKHLLSQVSEISSTVSLFALHMCHDTSIHVSDTILPADLGTGAIAAIHTNKPSGVSKH